MELGSLHAGMPRGYDLIGTQGRGWQSWRWRAHGADGSLVLSMIYPSAEQATSGAWSDYGLKLQLESWPAIARKVAREVGWRFGVTLADIRGRRKAKMLARARHLGWWLLRQWTPASYPEIGRYFNRDHSTVQTAVAKIAAEKPDERERLAHEILEHLKKENERRQ